VLDESTQLGLLVILLVEQVEPGRRDVTVGESSKRMETYYYGGRMWNGGRVCTGKTQPARCTYRRPMDGWKPTTTVVRWMGTGGGGVCTGRSRPARCDCRRVPMETYNYGRQMDVEKGGELCTGKTQPARCTYKRMET